MDLALRTKDAAFRQRVIEFLAVNWPVENRAQRWLLAQSGSSAYHRLPIVQQWLGALVTQGWSVPHWPEAFGGPSWNAVERAIWERETTLAQVPTAADFGINQLGPLLLRWGTQRQREQHLRSIRELRVNYSLGCAEPGIGANLAQGTTRATRQGDDFIINGTKLLQRTLLLDPLSAEWVLLVIGTAPAELTFLLVDLASPGVTIEASPPAAAGGPSRSRRVRLQDVWVPGAARVGAANAAAEIWQRLMQPGGFSSTRIARNRVQLDGLRELAADAAGPGSNDAGFAGQLRALEVAQLGQEMLERRLLYNAEQSAGQEKTLSPATEAMLVLRADQLDQAIGQLVQDALGYYALPAPDPELLANEGLIGPEYALVAMQGMLGQRSGPQGLSAEQLQWYKDIIAKSALAL